MQEAVAAKLLHLSVNLFLVLTLGDAVENSVCHHGAAYQYARKNTAQEQVASRNARRQGIKDEGDRRRDDNSKAAGDSDKTRAPLTVIA